jgi:hypothetical protein
VTVHRTRIKKDQLLNKSYYNLGTGEGDFNVKLMNEGTLKPNNQTDKSLQELILYSLPGICNARTKVLVYHIMFIRMFGILLCSDRRTYLFSPLSNVHYSIFS